MGGTNVHAQQWSKQQRENDEGVRDVGKVTQRTSHHRIRHQLHRRHSRRCQDARAPEVIHATERQQDLIGRYTVHDDRSYYVYLISIVIMIIVISNSNTINDSNSKSSGTITLEY